MNTVFIYLVQVNTGIVLFYLFYRLFFARDTFWKIRRMYLLLSIVASFAYPFISVWGLFVDHTPIKATLVRFVILPEILIHPKPVETIFTTTNILIAAYILVSIALLGRMVFQCIRIFQMRLQGTPFLHNGNKIIALNQPITPFSFFGMVFINPDLHAPAETDEILTHELAHAKQFHSIDVLMSELLCMLFWINPATWLLTREIRQNLEFLADNQVLRSGFDSKSYQYHLLRLSYTMPELRLGNQFTITSLKKRIIMMNKTNTKKQAVLKYLLILPLITVLVVVANAQNMVSGTNEMTARVQPTGNTQNTMPKSDELQIKSTSHGTTTVSSVNQPENKEKVYSIVEKMPEFKGGKKSLLHFLSSNIVYPPEAIKEKIQGAVIVQFIVNTSGKVTDPKVLRGVSKELDAEALRVIKRMPDWIPGSQNGKKVSVSYALPVRFAFDEQNKERTGK